MAEIDKGGLRVFQTLFVNFSKIKVVMKIVTPLVRVGILSQTRVVMVLFLKVGYDRLSFKKIGSRA
jgi:hypothetical protein